MVLMLVVVCGSDIVIIGDFFQVGVLVNQIFIDKSMVLMFVIFDGGDIRNDYQYILVMKKFDVFVEEESMLDKIVGVMVVKLLVMGNCVLMIEDMVL